MKTKRIIEIIMGVLLIFGMTVIIFKFMNWSFNFTHELRYEAYPPYVGFGLLFSTIGALMIYLWAVGLELIFPSTVSPILDESDELIKSKGV